jgi:hypothetical protein
MARDGLGYSLHFDNVSIGKEQSTNLLSSVSVNPIPFDFISQIRLVPQDNVVWEAKYFPVNFRHPNPSLYEMKLDNVPENSTLVLSQSFHSGWKAYLTQGDSNPLKNYLAPLLGKEIKEHLLVNNWENGWDLSELEAGQLEQNGRLVLIFWPQYLEFLGFFLGGLPWLLLLKKSFKSAER